MKKSTKIIIAVVVLLLLIGGTAWYVHSLQQKLDEANITIRKDKIKMDTLVMISPTQYRKLVADTLKARDLEKLVKELGIQLDAKPKIIYKTKIIIREVEKETDSVKIENDTLTIDSYYPQKENYFARYQNTVDLLKEKGMEKWSFNPVDIAIVLSQRKDGIWVSDIKTPPYMTVGSVDVQATPLETPKVDNFGFLIGAGYGHSFKEGQEDYMRISGALRFKKIYFEVGGSTNSTVDGGVKYEF